MNRPLPYRVDLDDGNEPHVELRPWRRPPSETEKNLDDFVYRVEEMDPYIEWLEKRIEELERCS